MAALRDAAVVTACLVMAALEARAADAPAPPAVPPGKAAKPQQNIAIANAGFEAKRPGSESLPDGWLLMQHAGEPAYVAIIDGETRRAGRYSGRLASIRPEAFGSLSQALPAAPWRGKTLRFSAWMRTLEVKGNDFGRGAGLFLNSMRGGYPLVYAQMQENAVAGTTDWTRYEVTLKVPADADTLEIGFIQFGLGTIWVDDAALDLVAER